MNFKKMFSIVLSMLVILSLIMPLGIQTIAADMNPVENDIYTQSEYFKKLSQVKTTGNYRDDVINVALSQVGYHEGDSEDDYAGNNLSGNNNFTEYGRFNNSIGNAWCSEFASWCVRVAGVPLSLISNSNGANAKRFTAGTSASYYEWSQTSWAGGNYTPQKGDIILWVWDSFSNPVSYDVSLSHTSILNNIVENEDGSLNLYVLHGNSNAAVRSSYYNINAQNGKRTDNFGYVAYIVSPDYDNTQVNKQIVNFNENGGSVDIKEKYVANGGLYGVLPLPERLGYKFLGWFDENGTRINMYSSCSLNNTQTLYAHWEKIPPCAVHTEGQSIVVKDSNCVREGEMSCICLICGETYKKVIPALGHDMTFHSAKDETCTENGNKAYYECSRCHNYYSDSAGNNIIADKTSIVIPAKQHKFEANEHYCLNGCGTANPDYVPPHVHSYTDVVTAPTCTEQGYTTHTCACGDVKVDTYVSALGHDFCNNAEVCRRGCGTANPDYVAPVHVHAYTKTVVAPKANAVGYTLNKCNCGDGFKSNYTAPTGKPSGFKCSSRTAVAIKFTWTKTSGVSGYQVQLLNSAGKSAGNKVLTGNAYSFTKLAAGHAYKARVRFYIKAADGKNYYGAWATINSPTLPASTSLTKVTGAKKAFTAQWKKATVTGYQLQYATNNKFSGAKNVTIKKAATLKYTVSKLAANKTFYVRIRTYKAISGANYYSTWSGAKAVKTK